MGNFKPWDMGHDQSWIRRVEKRMYHYIRIRDLHEWAGKEYAEQAGGRYLCDLTVIDLDMIPKAEWSAAFDDEDDLNYYNTLTTETEKDEYQVGLSVDFGSGIDLFSATSDSPKSLYKRASRISHFYD